MTATRRTQCQLCMRWFDSNLHESCPHDDGGEPCGWRPPAPKPKKRAVEGQLAEVDRDSWSLMSDEMQEAGLAAIADCRRSLDESRFRAALPVEQRHLLEDGRVVDAHTGEVA